MHQNISFVLELTKQCNNRCKYCYNVWKATPNYPKNEISARQWSALFRQVFRRVKPRQVALSGGEPLMHPEFDSILEALKSYSFPKTLITNGTLLTSELIKRCLHSTITLFELPLLSASAPIHDALTNNPGSWKKVIHSMELIKKHRGLLAVSFIITKTNYHEAKEVVEIAIALGADVIVCNRFNIGGRGIAFKKDLLPGIAELNKAYRVIDALAKEYEIPAHAGIPLPKCIFDTGLFSSISFSQCQIGGDYPYYAIDPAGNLRPCNHSAIILGNLLEDDFNTLVSQEILQRYAEALPKECVGCPEFSHLCRGGCKAAAEVYYHDYSKLDPFVAENFRNS